MHAAAAQKAGSFNRRVKNASPLPYNGSETAG
jgi:hypothetical protein